VSTGASNDTHSRIAVAACGAAIAALCVAAWIWSAGGIRVTAAGVAVSARTPWPSALAALGVLGVVRLIRGSRVAADVATLETLLARRESHVAALIAGVVLLVGLSYGSTVAGGADSSGYLNQAALWRRGEWQVREPLIAGSGIANAAWVVSPLGFRPGVEPGTIVPSYPPGLPLVFALASTLGDWGVALVVPVLGAAAVWLTFVLGRSAGGPGAGLPAAALVASSPVFLYQLVQPMTDVPVSAWWLAAFAALLAPSRSGGALAGVAAGVALATRPNLAPAVLALSVLLVVRQSGTATDRGVTGGAHPDDEPSSTARERACWFAAGVAPLVVLIGWFNNALYGAPWVSGYGDVSQLFSFSHVWANVRAYAGWLVETHLVLLVLSGSGVLLTVVRPPVGDRQRLTAALVLFAVLVTAVYLLYAPFEHWTYLRFLLPAMAAMAAPAGTAWSVALRRAPAWVRLAACTVGLTLVAGHGAALARNGGAFELADREQRYRLAAEWVRDNTLPQTLVVCAQHSGSIHYTAGRTVVRFDLLSSPVIDITGADRPIAVVLDAEEEPTFRTRLAASADLGRLDWPPRASTDPPAPTRVYLAEDRQHYHAGLPIATERLVRRR
jgi:hypothetical protein